VPHVRPSVRGTKTMGEAPTIAFLHRVANPEVLQPRWFPEPPTRHKPPGAPHPRFPVRLSGFDELYAPFLKERRTRGLVRWGVQEIRGISLVFREMWDTTALDVRFLRGVSWPVITYEHSPTPNPLQAHPSYRVSSKPSATPNTPITQAPRSPRRSAQTDAA
jgi:hypothetical protein